MRLAYSLRLDPWDADIGYLQDYAIRKMDGVNLDGQRVMCEMAKEFPDRRGPRVSLTPSRC